jgi:hypothetical protein
MGDCLPDAADRNAVQFTAIPAKAGIHQGRGWVERHKIRLWAVDAGLAFHSDPAYLATDRAAPTIGHPSGKF